MPTISMRAAGPGTLREHPIVQHFLKHYRSPHFYTLRTCTRCDYQIGYFVDENDRLFYDSGCECTYHNGPNIEPRSWEMLVEYFRAHQPEMDLLLALNIDRAGNDNPIAEDDEPEGEDDE